MVRTHRARAGVGALALALLASLWLSTPPAYAVGSAPVTVDDTGKMWAGNAVAVDVLANDTDADGDDLAICRVPESTSRKFDVFADGDQLVVISRQSAQPGTYDFSYYACDFEFLTEGTLTVTIKPRPDIKVKAPQNTMGKLVVKNHEDFKIQLLYGSFGEPEPDGVVIVAGNSSKVIRVHRTRISWIAYHANKGWFLRIGRVKDIELAPGDEPPAAGRLQVAPRLARLWSH